MSDQNIDPIDALTDAGLRQMVFNVLDNALEASPDWVALDVRCEDDAVVVVVSEETGSISIAERGRLDRHIPPEALAGMLRRRLASTRGGELDPTRPSTGGSDDAEQEGLDLPPLSGSLPEERTRTRKPAETASV